MPGKQLRRAGPDMADPEAVQEPRQRLGLRVIDRGDELRGTLLRKPVELRELVRGEQVDIGWIVHQAGFDELLDPGVREPADVHGAA
jgi:hypothetical protein